MIIDDMDKLRELEFLGKGKYGSVYKVDNDIAIKIYREYANYEWGRVELYKIPLKKFKLIRRKQSKIKNTDLIKDLIYKDGIIIGSVMKFVDGETLEDIKDNLSKSDKKDISMQLIHNAKELTDNGIYPTDYKLNNVMLTKTGNVKIIDLDDKLTHISRFGFNTVKACSLDTLKFTLIELFDNSSYDKNVHDAALMKKFFVSYKGLKEYVKKR